MLRTTLSKLKKACSSLSLAPRVLRGDTRYTPGKFQKLSITVLRKAEKSTKSGKDKDAECERCNKLIELIFGPSKPPDTIQGITKTELPDSDLHHISELHKDKLAETIVPQVPEVPDAQCEKADRVHSESYGKGEDDGKKRVLENVSDVPMDFQLNETTAKQTEEQLAQKLEIINETPMVEAEKPAIDGFNAPPRVLGNFDCRKFDDFEDIRIQSTAALNETERFGEDNMKNTIESLVRRIEETRRLEEVHRLEEIRRIELLLSNEIERADFKLPILNFSSDRQNRKSGASAVTHHPYDDLAKRCLDAPSSKIDERLLKEMEKLGVPQTSPRGESSVIEENIIQIDAKKPRKPVKKTEIDLETREFERDPPIAYVDKLHPAFQMANSPKTISDDETDSATLTTERIQLYELDKKPLTYSEYTEAAHEPMEMDAYENSSNVEPKASYDFSQAIIDPYDKKTIAFDNDGEECDPLWFEKYMIRQELIEQAKTAEPLEGATETSEVESDEAKNATAQLIAANQAVQCPNQSESTDQPKEDPEPYIAFESQPLEHASENWQFSEQPESISDTDISKERVNEPTSQPVTAETSTDHETIQLSIQIDPIESVNSEKAIEHPSETYHYISQSAPAETPKTNAEKNSETFEYLSPSESASLETNAPKHDNESYQFMTQPEPTPTVETPTLKDDTATFGFDNPEPTIPAETNTETRAETFQYSTPPEPAESSRANSMEQDVTYIEPSAEEVTMETPEQNNPNITPEQISHSFVQPQTMVNPLVDSRTLADPADEIQKTMTAACGPMPKLKSDEEISLSEMLKRVRMRNRMEYCQAYDRQVDPVTGKCGKKTPPCPPPAPKCPQCPPPPCPPPPPPCPRPCKPACPPPCPPPCPAKKNPCQKFKKHFPGFNLRNIITLLLQPESKMQKTASPPTFYVQISERSHAVLAQEMSLKLQEIGLNLLVAYPRKVSDSLSSNFRSENLTLARNYEPWVPIPSWPIPKKEKKRPFVCPKEGCKLLPPPKLRPPCNENPCINFPKRSNSFSIANLFSFALGDYVVFDIMD